MELPRISIRKHVYARCQGHCCYCGERVALAEATLDHVIPVSKRGKTLEANLVLACQACNRAKGARALRDFLLEDPERARWFVRFAFTTPPKVRRMAAMVATAVVT